MLEWVSTINQSTGIVYTCTWSSTWIYFNIKPDLEIHTDIHETCIHIVIINKGEEDFDMYITD